MTKLRPSKAHHEQQQEQKETCKSQLQPQRKEASFVLVNTVIIATLIILSVTVLQLFGCSSRPPLFRAHGSVGGNDDIITDQLLSNAQNYEIEVIRGDTQVFLGHYWFQTKQEQDIVQKLTSRSAMEQLQADKLLPLNEYQNQLLDDNGIHIGMEEQRCQRYGFELDPSRIHNRRRIFYGAPIADDSLFLLQTIATEGYNLYHTAAFVESNMTHTRSPRPWRFPPRSESLQLLQTLFGNTTQVSVDYFVPVDKDTLPDQGQGRSVFEWQFLHREAILKRWKRNGMRPDDIGVMADCDELFSRDFLRALQICDVPELRPNQDCYKPKIIATTLSYETSPECIVSNAKLWVPSAISGQCLEGIGDHNLHKSALRGFHGRHSRRATGYGRPSSNYDAFLAQHSNDTDFKDMTSHGKIMYPLWNGADYRTLMDGGRQLDFSHEVSYNAFHFHNFFESTDEIRHKYLTYGEPIQKANHVPLSAIHSALSVAVSCVHGWQNPGTRKYHLGGDKEVFASLSSSLTTNQGPRRPIFFDNPDIRNLRHQHVRSLIAKDEQQYGTANATCDSRACTIISQG